MALSLLFSHLRLQIDGFGICIYSGFGGALGRLSEYMTKGNDTTVRKDASIGQSGCYDALQAMLDLCSAQLDALLSFSRLQGSSGIRLLDLRWAVQNSMVVVWGVSGDSDTSVIHGRGRKRQGLDRVV